jgi:Flp pilus assembly protein TadB
MVTIGLLLLAVIALLLCGAAITAWRRERRRNRQLAERLIVEGRIEQLTVEALRSMRQVARQQLREQR